MVSVRNTTEMTEAFKREVQQFEKHAAFLKVTEGENTQTPAEVYGYYTHKHTCSLQAVRNFKTNLAVIQSSLFSCPLDAKGHKLKFNKKGHKYRIYQARKST
jgi:hypothetical protein